MPAGIKHIKNNINKHRHCLMENDFLQQINYPIKEAYSQEFRGFKVSEWSKECRSNI